MKPFPIAISICGLLVLLQVLPWPGRSAATWEASPVADRLPSLQSIAVEEPEAAFSTNTNSLATDRSEQALRVAEVSSSRFQQLLGSDAFAFRPLPVLPTSESGYFDDGTELSPVNESNEGSTVLRIRNRFYDEPVTPEPSRVTGMLPNGSAGTTINEFTRSEIRRVHSSTQDSDTGEQVPAGGQR